MDWESPSDGESNPCSIDAAMDLLADRRRRSALRQLLRRRDETVDFDDLVDRVHDRERTRRVDRDVDRRSIAVEFDHVHLPRLDDAGVLAYDRERGVVEYGGAPVVESILAEFEFPRSSEA